MNREPDVVRFIAMVSEQIRQRRKTLGLTQEQLAERAGLSVNYIARIEIVSKTPTLGTLHRIARALDTDVPKLLCNEETETASAADPIEYALSGLSESEAAFVLRQARSTAAYIRRHRSGQ